MTAPPPLSPTLGALLGVHTGDSLGATLEFTTHSRIKSTYPTGLRDIIGGGAFSWPPGHATDDTDLTRAVLLAYRDREEFRKAGSSQAEEFDVAKCAAECSLKWLEGDWPERKKGSRPIDIGGATLTGLSKYARSRDPKNCGAGPGSAGNGSLMRCIPTALFTRGREGRIKESMAISAVTHNDARCTVSCAVYNEIVASLVSGATPKGAVDVGLEVATSLDCPSVEAAISRGESLSISKIAEEGPGEELPDRTSGYVLQSLSVAIAALLDPRSFEDVLVDVVRIGGDTDTNGAIAGGLLGARDGIEAIPPRWLEKLQFRGEFEELARSILQSQAN
ncbi:ADP-ribosylglycohydrolase family protein [Trematosphaeria pertusa]|uniref:ADP-ribosylhydrolase ARH3 n=1 Tax=Trematosphaeria pertusa TaxID=390896 RepID=A0A6A6HWA3_9PLEO|nr:ADP-ribosylglycohydrolase family protein [Trematosphaeria pertusa]KAF2241680.1 ADP-ribosylglycohydrolase family protein [Trematosphaeria pertusa]